jgi:hypothetical protein
LANFIELKDYRSKIMRILLNNAQICSILLGRVITDTDDAEMQETLRDKQIHRVAFTPSVSVDTKTYICYELRLVSAGFNSNRSKVTLLFYIFSHKNDIVDSNTNYLKTDLLDEQIQYLFNENMDFGIGKVKCTSDDLFALGENYYGRKIEFQVPDLTTNKCI